MLIMLTGIPEVCILFNIIIFASKRKTISLIIALLLDNHFKNRDTFIQNLGRGVYTTIR